MATGPPCIIVGFARGQGGGSSGHGPPPRDHTVPPTCAPTLPSSSGPSGPPWAKLPQEPGQTPRHAAINIVKRSLTSAGVPSHLHQPASAVRTGNDQTERSHCHALEAGQVLVWDATCPDTYAPSHISVATREAGAVATQVEQRKQLKYAELEASHHFVPVAIETSGVCGPEAMQFLLELGHRLKAETREPRSLRFLFQRISVAIQRGNAAAVLGTIKAKHTDYYG